jgi:isocitrate dehydrogenase kinase/phosphatase
MTQGIEIARTILEGFDRHYRRFREVSAGAKGRFERGEWAAVQEANKARIQFYDLRVREAVGLVLARFPEATTDEALWAQLKLTYITLLYDHKQPECAETFFNSVACRVLHRRYYKNDYIFWRPALSTEHLHGTQPTYRCFYPKEDSVTPSLRDVIHSFELACPFEDLDRDLANVERAVHEIFPKGWVREPNFQLQVLSSLFYRNKAAYVVGRYVNGSAERPFVIPILRNADGTVYLDAILMKSENIGRIFSLARAYFMVDMEVPSAFVSFLRQIMPSKRKAELYTVVGLQKQGKTLLYRDMHEHLLHSSDSFEIAPGTRGMVMLVFTMPSFPYVFKIIRDWFEPPKDTDASIVRERYQMVKNHDRVGRLADTLEYSHVAFPRARFSEELIAELSRKAPSMVEMDGDSLIIKHMWVERRMIPLDMYVRAAEAEGDVAKLEQAIVEFGDAIRELASANIFPGDMLLKNFGVTRYGRVVFYDYDEIGYLTDYVFRRMPSPSDEDDTRGDDWFSVGVNDVFPEQFPTFLFPAGRPRDLFMKHHGDLADPVFWLEAQEHCRKGEMMDLFTYPQDLRFRNRWPQG